MFAMSVEMTNNVTYAPENWDDLRPFRFLCGTLAYDNGNAQTYWDVTHFCARLLLDATEAAENGKLYTWNAVGFDFICLEDSKGFIPHDFVLNHRDIMFDIYCHSGFPISLTSALKGFGLDLEVEKLEHCKQHFQEYLDNGKLDMIEAYSKIKTYCILDVAQKTIEGGGIKWVSQSGRTRWEILDDFMTVDECRKLELPDTSWMQHTALTKERFLGWMGLDK